MAKRSKFFRVAVEGATCDGRNIDRNDIVEMAQTYVPATYQARVNCEHLRGLLPNGDFGSYGDVVALKTQEDDFDIGGKTEKKLALYAQVDALDQLLAVQAKGQKLFSSIEINPNFAGTGKAYLQGLAITDSPASLGTEIMAFAAKAGDANPFAARKQAKDNLFSAAAEIAGLEFDDVKPADSDSGKLFAAATKFFERFTSNAPAEPAPKTVETPAADTPPAANDNLAALIGQGFSQLTAAITKQGEEFSADLAKIRTDHDTLKASVEQTDAGAPKRPAATGAPQGNYARTDC